MKQKIFINAFYNLALILSIFGIMWGYDNKSPLISIFFVAVFAAFLYFKIKLMKDLKKEFKKKP
ncbi:DUF6358 family protein [Pedobacter sp. ASV28]|jgi:Family of unknown function (DUF6358)|uniref:DUF6358 family protein n=1 Tax=Pedobacter sp. ASV28 TaxID=2795123 RepID=UPI0018EBBB84|nr:DUF6358 family protein [Pedobacter sp. ASV28]